MFKNNSSPEKNLKSLKDDEEVQEPLMKAMVAYTSTGNRGPMSQQLILLDDYNETEVTGIFQFALELRPSSSGEQLRCTKLVLRFMLEQYVAKRFPVLFANMRWWLDDVFTR